jgi:lactoylglutathione lyase
MTDGELDLALMRYDNEEVEEAQWAGAGPRIHHWGLEVADKPVFAAVIARAGGTILSKLGEGALKFRAPDGTLAEIVEKGRYKGA